MTSEEVRVGDCACPDTPHPDGDVVYLNPHLSTSGGIAAEQEISQGMVDEQELTRRLLLVFVRHEAIGWNRVDARGKPLPFDIDVLMGDWALSRSVAIRAGELYTSTAIAPFQKKPAERSPTGPTPASTSRTRKPTPSPSESP